MTPEANGTARRPRRAALGATVRAACLLLAVWPASAATFHVNDTTDRLDTNPGDGVCVSSNGTCTLRAAIQEANALPGAHIVRIPAGIFRLTRAPLNQNDITSGDLDITNSM